MRLLNFLAEAFIGFFGITEPKPGQQRLVNIVLGGFLLAGIALIAALGVFFVIALRHPR